MSRSIRFGSTLFSFQAAATRADSSAIERSSPASCTILSRSVARSWWASRAFSRPRLKTSRKRSRSASVYTLFLRSGLGFSRSTAASSPSRTGFSVSLIFLYISRVDRELELRDADQVQRHARDVGEGDRELVEDHLPASLDI